MSENIIELTHRSILILSGDDLFPFLEKLLTNTVKNLTPQESRYAALLSPQGKFLFEMILTRRGDGLLLDVETEHKAALIQKLTLYKLRADVTIKDAQNYKIYAASDTANLPDTGLISALPDPRAAALGVRAIYNSALPDTRLAGAPAEQAYELARIKAGVPDGSRDIKQDKYFWLETGAERLNGVSFTKGCYVGQELTSRMKHRTDVKKLILPVCIAGGASPHVELVTTSGKRAGETLTASGDYALAYIKLAYQDEDLFLAGKKVSILKPLTNLPQSIPCQP